MTTNRLAITDINQKPARVTEAMLRDAAARYNQLNWVRESGKLYFVGKQANGDGTFTHYLDRAV